MEFAKSRAQRARVPACLTCPRAYVPACLTCPRAYVPACPPFLRALWYYADQIRGYNLRFRSFLALAIFFSIQIFSGSNFFSVPIFIFPNFFFVANFFGPNFFFRSQIFFILIFFGRNFFYPQFFFAFNFFQYLIDRRLFSPCKEHMLAKRKFVSAGYCQPSLLVSSPSGKFHIPPLSYL